MNANAELMVGALLKDVHFVWFLSFRIHVSEAPSVEDVPCFRVCRMSK